MNAIIGVACAQASVLFRNANLKILFTKCCVHLRKFIVTSTALAVSLHNVKIAKIVMRVKKKELGD